MIKLNPKERIYLIKRRHPLFLKLKVFPLISISLLILFLILILIFKKIFWPQFLIERFPQISKLKLKFILVFLLSLILPIIWILIFFFITSFWLTYWIVTNQRTIFVEFLGLFNARYASLYHDKIQDIVIQIKGILPSLFHFGDVRIQSAGERGIFLIDKISEPEILKKIIFEAQMDFKRKI